MEKYSVKTTLRQLSVSKTWLVVMHGMKFPFEAGILAQRGVLPPTHSAVSSLVNMEAKPAPEEEVRAVDDDAEVDAVMAKASAEDAVLTQC